MSLFQDEIWIQWWCRADPSPLPERIQSILWLYRTISLFDHSYHYLAPSDGFNAAVGNCHLSFLPGRCIIRKERQDYLDPKRGDHVLSFAHECGRENNGKSIPQQSIRSKRLVISLKHVFNFDLTQKNK